MQDNTGVNSKIVYMVKGHLISGDNKFVLFKTQACLFENDNTEFVVRFFWFWN